MSKNECVTVAMDGANKNWLEVTAEEYGLSVEDTANELLRYGLVHHEEAIER